MTKSKGVGRGGARKGAGRRPDVAGVDWDAVARAYFTGSQTLDDICTEFGVSYGDLLAYGANNHWLQRRPTISRPDDVGDLASALAGAMFSIDGAGNRARCFVAAMVKLEATVSDIADVLRVSQSSLRADFAKELAGGG
jgi:hypothetical protein